MAGGPTTPALVRAVVDAGGWGFLAAGYLGAEAFQRDLDAVPDRDRVGVNLFVPQAPNVDPQAFASYADRLAGDADALGVGLSRTPVEDDDAWPGKLEVLLADPVPVVSLTFGLPSGSDITALQRAGSAVLATVTTPAEAREAEAAGVDGLVVQGPRAGGHSGTFDPRRPIGSEPIADV